MKINVKQWLLALGALSKLHDVAMPYFVAPREGLIRIDAGSRLFQASIPSGDVADFRVDGATLIAGLKRLDAPEAEIEVEEKALRLTAGRRKLALPVTLARFEGFPIPAPTAWVSMPAPVLARLPWLAAAMSTDTTREPLCALEADGKAIASTDGHRLHVLPCDSAPARFEAPAVKAALRAKRVRAFEAGSVLVSSTPTKYGGPLQKFATWHQITTADFVLTLASNQVNELTFPDWRQILPRDPANASARLDAAGIEALRGALPFASAPQVTQSKERKTTIHLADDGMMLHGVDPETGEATERIDVVEVAGKGKIHLNTRYVADALEGTETATCELHNMLSVWTLDGGAQALVMGLRD